VSGAVSGRLSASFSPGAEDSAQGARDPLGDLVLDGEHVCDGPVEALRPTVVPVGHVDELDRNPQPGAGLAHAALEDRGDPQSGTHGPNVHGRPAELEGGAARRHPQALDVGQAVDELLGDALAQVVLVPSRAHVGEGQDGDGGTGAGGRGRLTLKSRRGRAEVAADRLQGEGQIRGGLEPGGSVLLHAVEHQAGEGRRGDVQGGGGPRLLLEAANHVGPGGLRSDQDLHRHVALQPGVASPVDRTHPAGGEVLPNHVWPDLGSRGEAHSRDSSLLACSRGSVVREATPPGSR